MILLSDITFHTQNVDAYPYHLPFFNQKITFDQPITILIGDNGCGKSTLLELMKSYLNLHGFSNSNISLKGISTKVSYHLTKPKGLYFSSEDFTTYIKHLEQEKRASHEAIKEVDENYQHRSKLATMLAKSPHMKTIYEIEQLHDRNLDQASHGEAYLSFFKSRMRKNQLILLDEPETPLSFQNQLALLYIIKETIDSGSQMIIATHSPVIMAYPNAQIYQINDQGIQQIAYESIEQVQSLKSFLIDPNRYFKHLF